MLLVAVIVDDYFEDVELLEPLDLIDQQAIARAALERHLAARARSRDVDVEVRLA